jgi:FkbM family methyltransferase
MQKIIHLYRLDFSNRIIVIKYLFKRIFKLKTTTNERLINDYYYHLIKLQGFFKEQTENYFIAYYPKWKATIKTRKRPSSDLDVFAQVFGDLEYKSVVDNFKANFKTNQSLRIIDAGSNIGLTTLYFSRFFADAEFICIEPNVSNLDVLTFNLDANSIANTHKIRAGVWSKNTNLNIISDFRGHYDWSYRVVEAENETDLKAFSIPYLVEKFNWDSIDILKMDIEGSEKEVFTNPASDISFLAITKCIAIEIHDEFDCREAICKILKNSGFSLFNSGELTIGVNQNWIHK